MDDDKKIVPDTEELVIDVVEPDQDDNSIVVLDVDDTPDEDASVEDAVDIAEEPADPVTEEDVIAAFFDANKTLTTNPDEAGDDDVTAVAAPEDMNAANEDVRGEFVRQFQFDFSLDDIPDAEGMGNGADEEDATQDELPIVQYNEIPIADEPLSEHPQADDDTPRSGGCLSRLIFSMLIVLVSIALAAFITTAIFDVTGLNRNNREADVVIPKGADTAKVASILKDKGLIDYELYFRWYVRFMNLDHKWKAGSFQLRADMGFPTLVNTIQAQPPRETVMVMFPEGLTVPEMAQLLEENKVCTAEEFINAVRYGDYDYDFVRKIPTEADDPEYANRAYRLEGYLFPDTYEFYVGSLGETVVDRMLQNFETKVSQPLSAKIKDSGWTLDQAVIFASIVQGEADTKENMEKVSRVMYNRLEPTSGYKQLQLCSTRDYANYLLSLETEEYDADLLKQAYNTYLREGFPIGAINNPGFAAFNAVLKPSIDEDTMKCYYFATDYDTGITYFSKTFEEHQAICKKYGIEDIG